MSAKRRLGRGLDVLLGAGYTHPALSEQPAAGQLATLEMALDALRPGRYQPRRTLSETGLAELAASIREQGVLQPLVVRPARSADPQTDPSTHEIVAGERRWRAARMAGLSTVPVIVRELDDRSALAVSLIENLQREDLNPMEQALSMSRLAEEFELTHQQVAEAVGRSRSSVSNLLRLLDLHDDVKEQLAAGRIDMGHARALLALDPEAQAAIARRIVASGWSVRQVENAVRSRLEARTAGESPAAPPIDLQTRWLQQQIAKELGQKVTIRGRNNGRYKLDIEFGDLAQLQNSLRNIQNLIEQVRTAAGPRTRDLAELT